LGIILFPSVIGTVLGQCLYVAQRHGLAAGLGVFETILYFVVAIPLVQRFGLKGLVIAKIIDWYIALGLDFYFLQKILVWKLSRLFKTCGKSFFASLLVVGGALVLRSQHAPFVLSVGILGMGYYAVIRSLNLSSDLREFERYFWKQISVVLGRLKKRFKVAG
jgi:O-antigen/teichoic acid export membrane protein